MFLMPIKHTNLDFSHFNLNGSYLHAFATIPPLYSVSALFNSVYQNVYLTLQTKGKHKMDKSCLM